MTTTAHTPQQLDQLAEALDTGRITYRGLLRDHGLRHSDLRETFARRDAAAEADGQTWTIEPARSTWIVGAGEQVPADEPATHTVRILTSAGAVHVLTLPDEAGLTVEVNGREYVGVLMPTSDGDDVRPVCVTTFDDADSTTTTEPEGVPGPVDEPADVDPLAAVRVGDEDPTADTYGNWCGAHVAEGMRCTRATHAADWLHLVGNGMSVIATVRRGERPAVMPDYAG
jgi:hypothetical protein